MPRQMGATPEPVVGYGRIVVVKVGVFEGIINTAETTLLNPMFLHAIAEVEGKPVDMIQEALGEWYLYGMVERSGQQLVPAGIAGLWGTQPTENRILFLSSYPISPGNPITQELPTPKQAIPNQQPLLQFLVTVPEGCGYDFGFYPDGFGNQWRIVGIVPFNWKEGVIEGADKLQRLFAKSQTLVSVIPSIRKAAMLDVRLQKYERRDEVRQRELEEAYEDNAELYGRSNASLHTAYMPPITEELPFAGQPQRSSIWGYILIAGFVGYAFLGPELFRNGSVTPIGTAQIVGAVIAAAVVYVLLGQRRGGFSQ